MNDKGHKRRTIWIFCDGSAGNNETMSGEATAPTNSQRLKPVGACGAAAIARGADGQIIDWSWRALPAMSNNEAEYAGLLLGLELAWRLGAQQAILVLDSDTVVGQMEGRFAVNSHALRRWHWRACAALRNLPAVRFCVVPRAWNELADALASQVCIPWATLCHALEESNAGKR